MNSFKQLSTRHFKDAKKLGFTWMDLVKRETRQKVISKVIEHKMDEAILKAKRIASNIKSKRPSLMQKRIASNTKFVNQNSNRWKMKSEESTKN